MASTLLKDYIFTSESVSEGHPDKVCDRISDTIVDAYLSIDPFSRTAVETVATTDFVAIVGETRCSNEISHGDIQELTREAIRSIGYDQEGFSWKTVKIDCRLHAQSVDIAVGVDSDGAKDEGAGDQGIMFGYACHETPVFMPAPIFYAHNILHVLAADRHAGVLSMLEPDAKSQVTLEYRDGVPVGAKSIVVSTQHVEG
ncbi:MAG TPA: S-adenosylmethionine synthetase N-terminal domain-containing protein, partial [Alphaproteobacteria bacterium]|nr:S-adenosylmethionine synthetase N-terminal domain-containing protein [Alphaproteobacteria bacterium]